MTNISRRTLLTSFAASAVVGAAADAFPLVASPAAASNHHPCPVARNIDSFVELSAQLTGVDGSVLAPCVDPIGMAPLIRDRANAKHKETLDSMLAVLDASNTDAADIILNRSGNDMRFLARSIMLAWYLGVWYEPDELKKPQPSISEVISPSAYTESLVWRVAQAHPMGYSNLQFGYWGTEPPVRDRFTKPLPNPSAPPKKELEGAL